MDWISVEDKLPEELELVLVFINDDLISVGSWENKHHGCWRVGNDCIAWDYDFAFGEECDITHWMPLPNPPEE